MAQDDPLSELLPKPPPPRPDAREAAIGEAMRRFDGGQAAPPAIGRAPGARRGWLAFPWGRPQLGAVLATALVGLVSLPLWIARDRHPELASPATRTADIAADTPRGIAPPTVVAPPSKMDAAAATSEGAAKPVAPAPTEAKVAGEKAKAEEPAAAMADMAREERSAVAVSQRAASSAPSPLILAEPAMAPPPPPAAPPAIAANRAAEARERDDIGQDVIVTARRVDSRSSWKPAAPPRRPQARRSSRAGDWNACTVNDPARSAGACGEAAAGLSRAWQGDLEGAIAEFDRTIAASPQSGSAYLNRGLAYERQGDLRRALADLDRAVQRAPNSARTLYSRSLVLARKGDKDRAADDAERAVELDPRYRAVVQ